MVRNDGISPVSGPPGIIDWSDRLEQAALDMRREIIVMVFGDHLHSTLGKIREIMVVRFGLDLTTIVAKVAGDTTFFVFLSDEDTTARWLTPNQLQDPGGLDSTSSAGLSRPSLPARTFWSSSMSS